jgi:hypothetical protein
VKIGVNGHAFTWGRPRDRDEYLAPYHRLALQLRRDIAENDSSRSALIVSPDASPACAFGSAMLARCLAEESGGSVLLVDACAKESELTRRLDCVGQAGFAEFMKDATLPLERMVFPTSHDRVYFLPAGRRNGVRYPALSGNLSSVLEAAQSDFDYVLFSGGRLLDESIALMLAPRVGCVLLLVVEHQTKVEELDHAQDALGLCKPRKVGLVLTTPVGDDWWGA